ncbi:MAG TPA: 3-hydroxyacyl-CoA dehydrogenase family protein [Gemmatimonadales bacterium]|nr:3-hydroxyacyl-CoA dehydrogenase family protein [Gemmatimonadales bacterium]
MVSRVAVIGAGTMGRDIAYVACACGCKVRLFDERPDAVTAGLQRVAELVDQGIMRGKIPLIERDTVLDRVTRVSTLEAAAKGVELVVEAIVEDMTAKRAVFAALERACPTDALLATNTSSLSIAAIAAGVQQPGRVLGMHFFNPVPAMRLVEIVTHAGNDRATIDRAVEFARQVGKEPILVKDSPGFASSRLGVALGLEAMRMLEEGVASAEDIDKAMELGYNHPMGPLKLTDLVGLDVRLAIAEYLHRTLEEPQFKPPRMLREKVAKGELGKKTGRGFYSWGG